MNRYKICVDDIMTNCQYNDNTESESDDNIAYDVQYGGTTNNNMPTGGFPPIYLCEKDEVVEDKDITKREFKTHKTTISIKDIMKKRRDTTPFI